jgi:hypothetical protein
MMIKGQWHYQGTTDAVVAWHQQGAAKPKQTKKI